MRVRGESGISRDWLEEIYFLYNHREYVHPDPLEFLYNFESCGDMEIAGLIASSLAYGNVKQILRSVKSVLDRMGNSPLNFVMNTSEKEKKYCFKNFKHRFTTGQEVAELLERTKKLILEYGSLGAFIQKVSGSESSIIDIQEEFVKQLISGVKSTLLPEVKRGSASKRLNLFFRWMVRKDEVDPGCWSGKILPSQLLIPLDTHMYRFAVKFGITRRKSANLKTEMEITDFFKKVNPEDPVKYDFAITRAGIGRWYEWDQK